MILLPGVDILHIALVVHKVRQGADEVLAAAEHLQHRPSVRREPQPVVELHLARQPGVIPGLPAQKMRAALHHGRNALAPALVEDGGVCHPVDHPAPQQRVVLLGLPDALGLLHRVDAQTLVGASGAAVQLLDAV